MNFSDAPYAAQFAALNTLLGVVTALTAAAVKNGSVDPDVFGKMLDDLMATQEPESTKVGQDMRESIVYMFKTIAQGEAQP